MVRERTRTLISFGDCAVTSNVPGMRNPIGVAPLLDRAYIENVTLNPQHPVAGRAARSCRWRSRSTGSSRSTSSCRAARRRADLIYTLLDDLLAGRVPDVAGARFGR